MAIHCPRDPFPQSTNQIAGGIWRCIISHNEIGSSSHRVNEGNLFPMLVLCGSVFFPFQSLKIYVLLTWLKWGCWQRHCLPRLEAVSFDLILQEGKKSILWDEVMGTYLCLVRPSHLITLWGKPSCKLCILPHIVLHLSWSLWFWLSYH